MVCDMLENQMRSVSGMPAPVYCLEGVSRLQCGEGNPHKAWYPKLIDEIESLERLRQLEFTRTDLVQERKVWKSAEGPPGGVREISTSVWGSSMGERKQPQTRVRENSTQHWRRARNSACSYSQAGKAQDSRGTGQRNQNGVASGGEY